MFGGTDMGEGLYVKPNLLAYRAVQLAAGALAVFVFRRRFVRNEIKGVDGPYAVIANHECALDFVTLIGATRKRLTFVLSNSFYSSLPARALLDKLGIIAKQQFQTTVSDMKKIKAVIDSGESLVIYPAGLMCEDGVSTPIPEATYKFLKWLGGEGGSADPSHQLAMLECMAEAVGEGEEGLKRLLAETKAELERTKGAEARAGIKLAQAVNSRTTDAAKMQELRDLYRGEVIGFTTPQDCFRSLLASRGKGQLEAAIAFLIEGAGDDLNSPSPSQGKEELRRIILDLQCVEVLKTVLERMCRLAVRMEREFAEKSALDGEALTGRIMDFTEMEFMTPETVSGLVTACALAKDRTRMDFLTELIIVFRSLSARLFETEEGRVRLVEAAQEVLDGVVERVAKDDQTKNMRVVVS